jgi:aminomuconate-semialdehyde/2-hydroxymuconate-6-semialdehyde dehydrogenase
VVQGRLGQWIGGNEVFGGAETFEVIAPATEERLCVAEVASREAVDAAVRAAAEAQERWGALAARERARAVERLADRLEERLEELASLEASDTGKPLSLARSLDIPRSVLNFRFFADYVATLGTEAFATDDVAINYSLRRPLGVVGLISPWNLPLLLLTWKVAPAIAAGNGVVAKPAELTPLTAYELGRAAVEAGLPAGLINVVNGFGPASTGEHLVAHPGIAGISLTGETTTGQAVMANAAKTLKRLSFELGGKNPVLVFADCNLDEAIETTVRSSFVNQGEVCLCGSRIYVEEPIYDLFVERLVDRARSLRVGDPFDPETDMGALISAEHRERVQGFVERAVDDGARVLVGGGRPAHLERGYYFDPTVLVDVKPRCEIVTEEVFGPVVTVEPFREEAEAVRLANDTRYGLAATVWTENLSRAHRVARQLEAGIVWVNTWFLRDLRTPFGGMKDSGIGREGGVHSFEFYTELTNVCIRVGEAQ